MTNEKQKFPKQITIPLRGDDHLHDALHKYAKSIDQPAAQVGRRVLRKHLLAAGYYEPEKVPQGDS